jgi:hypothetical protein
MTKFEQQGLAKGHVVHDLVFTRNATRNAAGDARNANARTASAPTA